MMPAFLKNLFGSRPALNIDELLLKGAVIVDVRSEQEFKRGHADGSINMPLDLLSTKCATLPKGKPVITCCASGMRSATAKNMLLKKGFIEVYNGGSWTSIRRKRN